MLTTIEEVIATGLRVSTISDDDTLPDMAEATEKHIKPFLGATLVTALQDAYTNAAADAALRSLLPLVQKPLAAFAYLGELAATHVRITGAGVRRTATDNMPTAFRWEYDKAEAYLEERAFSTLETLLLYIDANAVALDEWLDADIVAARKSLLIKSGTDFGRFMHLQYPYLSWYRMLPVLKDVTEMNIIATFGQDFYNELLGVTSTDATTDPAGAEAKELTLWLQRAVANLTIAQATHKMAVKVTGLGFTVTGSQANSGNQDTATLEQLNRLTKRCEMDGKMYLRKAINYANSKASATLFATYYQSSHYTAPGSTIIDRKNDERKTFRM